MLKPVTENATLGLREVVAIDLYTICYKKNVFFPEGFLFYFSLFKMNRSNTPRSANGIC